jgi:hypothetical protein
MSNMFKAAGSAMASKAIGKAAQAGDTASALANLSQDDIEEMLRDRLLSGGKKGGMTDMSPTLGSSRMRQQTPVIYDPRKIYGGMFQSYGGRGGLLGED